MQFSNYIAERRCLRCDARILQKIKVEIFFKQFSFFRGKSEHKISVWWSSYWASMTPSRDCPKRRATSLVQGGWHVKFPANPPWRKSRTKTRRSAGRTRSHSWPTSNCGNTPSPTNQARDRNPRSCPNKQILLPDQQLPQPTKVVFFYPNRCKRTPFLDKSVWRNSRRIKRIVFIGLVSVMSSFLVSEFSLIAFHWWKLGFVMKANDRRPALAHSS